MTVIESKDSNAVPERQSFCPPIAGYDIFIEVDGLGSYMMMTYGLGANTNAFQPLVEVFAAGTPSLGSTGPV